MTTKKIIQTVLFTALLPLQAMAEKISLEGVWQLVSADHQYQVDGPIVKLKSSNTLKSFKIIKDGYYSILTQDPTRAIFGAHFGTYNVNGELYTESFIIHKQPTEINSSAQFKFKLEGDLWYIFSSDINEVWQKVATAKN